MYQWLPEFNGFFFITAEMLQSYQFRNIHKNKSLITSIPTKKQVHPGKTYINLCILDFFFFQYRRESVWMYTLVGLLLYRGWEPN